MKAFNLGSDIPFGQDLTPLLLPAVQPEMDLLGVHPDHGLF